MSISKKINKTPNILVIGDFILDQYYWTKVTRISPEAPVPICHIQETTHCLGGAGNVANNLSIFGSKVSVSGIIGKDENAGIMNDCFKHVDINTELMMVKDDYTTICKSRILAKGQQICRLDHELNRQEIEINSNEIFEKIDNKDLKFDSIVISDYNKGMISESLVKKIVKLAQKHNISTIVDPKSDNIKKYEGTSIITPNMNEFKEMTNSKQFKNNSEIVEKGKKLIADNNIKTLILTRSEEGMTMIQQDQVKHYPTKAIKVSDITGAGDTVVAAIAFGEALKFDFDTTINFANIAAGVVVSKVATSTASIQEIEEYEQRI